MKTRMIALMLIMLFAVVFFSYRLQQWPTSWYDEGIHLQVSKNLALSGRYGIQSSEGFRYFDPLVTTGPTVTLPIAIVFGLAGVSLLWARAVIVIYALLTVLVYFLVVEKLFKLNTAVVATLLLISLSASFDDISGSFLALSRMDMGEVPAIFWMLVGSLLWYLHLEKRGYVTRRWLVL
jgi:4-amino-4-deoxy-L-arabinose transferase-like glycosyltransferase